MTNTETEIAKLLLIGHEKSRSTVSIFIPSITPLEKQNLGQLLILTEIDSQDKINQLVIQVIEEAVKDSYYGSDNFNIEVAFENALQKTNQKLHELILAGQNAWLKKFNCLIAVHKGQELHLAQLGNTFVFLIHNYRILNILEQAGDSFGKINPLKIFSNIISGTLNENDCLLCCNGSLLDYLSQEKLRRIIIENTPEKTVSLLNQLLSENTGDITFAAIILKVEPTFEKIEKKEKKFTVETASSSNLSAPQTSMSKLIDKERTTSELLTPSLLPNFTKALKGFLVKIQRYQHKKIRQKSELFLNEEKELTQEKLSETKEFESPQAPQPPAKGLGIIFAIFNYLFQIIKKLFGLIIVSMRKMMDFFRQRKTIHGRIRTLPHRTNREAARFLIRLKNLSTPRKFILLVAVLLFVVFAYNIVNLGKREEKKQLKEEYANNLNQASEKSSEAEAALIYENEEDARILLSEAKNLLAKIPTGQKEFQNKVTELSKKIQEQLNKVNHIIKIEGPNQVTDLSQTVSDVSPIGLVKLGDSLYAYETKQNQIFAVSPTDQKVTTLKNTGAVEGNIIKGIPITTNRILFYTTVDQFYEYDTNDHSFTNKVVESANVDKKIQDFDTYLSRIYTLDTKNNQVFRHEKTQDKHSKGIPWIIEEKLDLSNATSLALDGSVYIAKNNGEIWKLFGGKRVNDFKPSKIDPLFSTPTKIITTPELTRLYILDPNNKRIVVLNKEGGLVNQYYSEQFDNLKDFTVSEKEKAIYLLNGNKIFKIETE